MASATDLPPHISVATPHFDPSVFVAPGAQVIGDVTIGNNSSIWYNAVVRGDIREIQIGCNTNIQDGSILHVGNEHPCIVGDNCTVGHHVNLHGCLVEEACLIGIGAIILSGAVIGRGSVIAAGAVVREGQIVPPGSMIAGVPGKNIKDLGETAIDTHREWAQKYCQLAQIHGGRNA